MRSRPFSDKSGRAKTARAGAFKGTTLIPGQPAIARIRQDPISRRRTCQEVFELRAQGWSAARIAAELNARGVPSRGSTWARGKRRRQRRGLASAIAASEYCERIVFTVRNGLDEPGVCNMAPPAANHCTPVTAKEGRSVFEPLERASW